MNLYIFSDGVDFHSQSQFTGLFTDGGNVQYCVTIYINDDDCVEDKESFEVVLSSSDPYVDVHISEANVTIWDNDCEYYIHTSPLHNNTPLMLTTDAEFGVENDVYYVEENAGFVTVCAELLEGCLERDVVVDCKTVDGTANSMF